MVLMWPVMVQPERGRKAAEPKPVNLQRRRQELMLGKKGAVQNISCVPV